VKRREGQKKLIACKKMEKKEGKEYIYLVYFVFSEGP